MLGPVDQLLFALRMGTPEQEYRVGLVLTDHFNDPVSEKLPPLLGMRGGICALHGHGGVEQQHPLIGPMLQAAMFGNLDVQVAV
ncbi:hypothetical protein D3C76_1431670 [compost metagenome]